MYFEDVVIGTEMEIGSWTFTEEEIIAFAKAYDPQPFHTDPAYAANHEFGGLVAAGFHVTAIWMKLMVANRAKNRAAQEQNGEPVKGGSSGVSPGFRKLRWLIPVRPGDTITYRSTTFAKVDLKSRDDVGIVESKTVGINQRGETVFSVIGKGLYTRRPKSA